MAHERGLELRAVDLDEVDGVGGLLLHYVRLEFTISKEACPKCAGGWGGVGDEGGGGTSLRKYWPPTMRNGRSKLGTRLSILACLNVERGW